jgi:hypothetical protein
MKRFLIAAPIMLILCSCATFGSAPVYGEIPECERLIPDSLKQPVPGVPIPDSEDAEPWMQAFVGQTGALDKANERAPAIDHIYSECLKMHREELQKAKRGFFGRLFG